MIRSLHLATLALLALLAVPVLAEIETREMDPLSEKDLTSFRVEGSGGWKIDNESDLIYTLIVCPKAEEETSLLFISRTFTQGFQLRMDVMGGSKYKGLDLLIVPPEGERIVVPLQRRNLNKKDWRDFVLTVEDGKAKIEIDGDAGDPVEVPKGVPLTFALRVPRRGEASFRKPKIRYLLVNEDQVKAAEGFIRIFDGKSMDGWKSLPEGVEGFTLADEHIVGKVPEGQREVDLVFTDAVFKDYVLKFRASGDSRDLVLVGRPGIKDQYPATFASISNYFPGDREWNDIVWTVEGKNVSLQVNGSKVWETTAPNDAPINPVFALTNAGRTRIRDIQVRGQVVSAGAAFERYAKESGVDIRAGGGSFGGRANPGAGGEAGGAGTGTGSLEKKILFDGSSLDEWQYGPPDVWSLIKEDKKVIGLTLEKKTGGEILYGKLVFFEYRITCRIQQGTAGAHFIAKRVPKQVAERPDAIVRLADDWFSEPWNEFEAWCRDSVVKIKVNGKEVYTGKVPAEQGFIGFRIDQESAIGLMDVVFSRPD